MRIEWITQFATVFALALVFAGQGARADDDAPDCRLKLYASLPINTDHRDEIYVPVTLDGHEKFLGIDTGASVSFLTSEAVDEIGLPKSDMRLPIPTASGNLATKKVVVSSFGLGRQIGTDIKFAVLPEGELQGFAAGFIGADIIRNYDVEFDFAANKVNLFSHDHCPGKVIYWTHEPYATMPFRIDGGNHIIIPVTLDDQKIWAVLDTGATNATMKLSSARSVFGWGDTPPAGLRLLPGRHGGLLYPFKTLKFGDATVHDPTVVMTPRLYLPQEDMLVGLSALKAFHIFVAYDEHTIFLTTATAH